MNEAGGFGSVVGGMMLFIIALAIPWPLLIVGGVILVVGILFACMKKKPEQSPTPNDSCTSYTSNTIRRMPLSSKC